MSVTVKVHFDTRSIRKKNNTYPFKLRVYNGITKYYPTIFGLSRKDKDKLPASRLSKKLQEVKSKLKEIEQTAAEAMRGLVPFSFDDFEREFIRDNPLFDQTRIKLKPISESYKEFDFTPFFKKFPILQEIHEAGTIGEVYVFVIRKKLMKGKISTASIYQQSYISLVKFGGNILFQGITEDFLQLYELWMKTNTDGKKKKSGKTTIGFYMRSLRRVFNVAASLKIIRKDKYYPFGRDKYVIPTSRNIKKALEINEIQQIYYFKCDARMPWLKKAKAFWFFMYFGNGMNPKDVALLQYKNITGEFIEFERSKTEETLKEDPPKISVFINEDMIETIKKYGNKNKDAENYIFPIFEQGMTPLRQFEVKELFIKFVNKWMRYISNKLGIKKKSTTYVARHSYATVRRRNGATIDDIQDELGQVEAESARRYVASLDCEQKRSNAAQLEAFKQLKSEKAACSICHFNINPVK